MYCSNNHHKNTSKAFILEKQLSECCLLDFCFPVTNLTCIRINLPFIHTVDLWGKTFMLFMASNSFLPIMILHIVEKYYAKSEVIWAAKIQMTNRNTVQNMPDFHSPDMVLLNNEWYNIHVILGNITLEVWISTLLPSTVTYIFIQGFCALDIC